MGSDAPRNSVLTCQFAVPSGPKPYLQFRGACSQSVTGEGGGAPWQPGPRIVVWRTPPCLQTSERCTLQKCSSQNTSSWLPSPNDSPLSLTHSPGGGQMLCMWV